MRLLLLLTLLLAACTSPSPTAAPTVTPFVLVTDVPATPTAGTQPEASPTTPPEAASPVPTEAAAAAGYVTQGAGTAGVEAAVAEAAAEFGWQVQAEQGAGALTSLAEAGVPVVVADGAALAAPARAAAQAFPNTYFIGVNHAGAEPALPNLLTLGGDAAREDQLGFVAGAIGGLLTEGDIVTAIGYPATPQGLKYRNGFLHGIRFTCSRCRVDFIDSVDQTSDAVAVAERASLNANLSSDVVFAAAGAAGLQGLQAAAQKGAWVIGIDPADATTTFAPGQPGAEQWVTSVYFDLGAAVAAALRAHQAGAPLSGAQPLSAASGALVVAPYRLSEDDLTPLDRQDIAALIARLADGSLETGIDPVSGQER